jgi:hypothetical protein
MRYSVRSDRSSRSVTDYRVSEKAQAGDARSVRDISGRAAVSLAGLWRAVRMVVSNGKGSTVEAKHCVEDLSRGHKGSIDRAFRNDHGPNETVGSVADENEDSLATQPI